MSSRHKPHRRDLRPSPIDGRAVTTRDDGAQQFAALPWRRLVDGSIKVLLITSRETRRWVIPKGWPMTGLTPGEAAIQEAYEEAGVFGDSTKPGMYGIVIKWPPHTFSRPHSHPNDRFVTVLSGAWWINTGAKFNSDTMVPMKPGAFVIHHAGEIHYDGTKDEPAMIYIVGMGPAPSIPREDPSTAPKK